MSGVAKTARYFGLTFVIRQFVLFRRPMLAAKRSPGILRLLRLEERTKRHPLRWRAG
jgi:hypothetical protein